MSMLLSIGIPVAVSLGGISYLYHKRLIKRRLDNKPLLDIEEDNKPAYIRI